jgi:hypothetical protein
VKAASSQELVPTVRYEDTERAGNEPPASDSGARVGGKLPASGLGADLPSAPFDSEVMEIGEDP